MQKTFDGIIGENQSIATKTGQYYTNFPLFEM